MESGRGKTALLLQLLGLLEGERKILGPLVTPRGLAITNAENTTTYLRELISVGLPELHAIVIQQVKESILGFLSI